MVERKEMEIDMDIRVSYGSALELGLKSGEIEEKPTTAYLMIPGEEKCRGGCNFCPQSEGDSKWLSRVSWPLFDLESVKEKLRRSDIKRICIQSPDIPDYEEKLKKVVNELDSLGKPISLSAPPLEKETLKSMKGSVERVGIGIDAATDSLRSEAKPSYQPMVFWDYLGNVVDIYGEGKATAHIIVGLGEDFGELVSAVKKSIEVGAEVSLFPYNDGKDGAELPYYRRAQLVTSLINNRMGTKTAIKLISEKPRKALAMVDEEQVFQTQGCPRCNRPYYTSSPGDEHRNFPRKPKAEEIEKIRKEIIGDDD
ncbi:MAG: radical SAM protein [Candidatus Thermoplasmatota archaeon]